MAKKKLWIKNAIGGDKGKLHENLGIPKGEKIPEDKLRAAANSKDPTIRKEANLAMTLKGFKKDKIKTHRNIQEKMYGKKKKV